MAETMIPMALQSLRQNPKIRELKVYEKDPEEVKFDNLRESATNGHRFVCWKPDDSTGETGTLMLAQEEILRAFQSRHADQNPCLFFSIPYGFEKRL